LTENLPFKTPDCQHSWKEEDALNSLHLAGIKVKLLLCSVHGYLYRCPIGFSTTKFPIGVSLGFQPRSSLKYLAN